MIGVTLTDKDTYQVVVESHPEVTHTVRMPRAYYLALSGGRCTQEWVIVQAFRFLLEREPASAILQKFELSDISRYFPEFESEMAERLADR